MKTIIIGGVAGGWRLYESAINERTVPECSFSPHPRCFCCLYSNSCSAKSQGLSQNKFCPAVDKEKGAIATARCL